MPIGSKCWVLWLLGSVRLVFVAMQIKVTPLSMALRNHVLAVCLPDYFQFKKLFLKESQAVKRPISTTALCIIETS